MGSGATASASAVVLAGGHSRRLGHDKRLLKLWGASGPTLLERTVAIVRALCADTVVVLNDPAAWAHLPARLVPDQYPDGGALGGLYSGLAAARESYALVVACDMPLLNATLLGAMLARPRDYDVLAPRSLNAGVTRNSLDLETLHAVYAKRCLAPMRAVLDAGQRRVTAFFPAVQVAVFTPAESRAHDPGGYSFLNVNTVEQVAEARQALAATRPEPPA